MTQILPIIRNMNYDEVEEAGLHSRGLTLDYEGKTYRLNSGTNDTIHVFTRSIYIFVLTLNWPLGYLGLDTYV